MVVQNDADYDVIEPDAVDELSSNCGQRQLHLHKLVLNVVK